MEVCGFVDKCYLEINVRSADVHDVVHVRYNATRVDRLRHILAHALTRL
jgi:hypothetical protein